LEHAIIYQRWHTGTTIELLLVFAMIIRVVLLNLATTGLAIYRFGWELLLALLLIGLTGIILIQRGNKELIP
jgi:hypothetical protein